MVALRGRHDEVCTDDLEDVGGVAVEGMRGEQLVELVGRAGLDGGLQQLGLTSEPTVDRSGREARPA